MLGAQLAIDNQNQRLQSESVPESVPESAMQKRTQFRFTHLGDGEAFLEPISLGPGSPTRLASQWFLHSRTAVALAAVFFCDARLNGVNLDTIAS